MPFVMNRDIPETYEELKQAFIAECKQRFEDNELARTKIAEAKKLLEDTEMDVEEYRDLYYEHNDDWVWCYGSMRVTDEDDEDDQEYVFNIAGGGDHWENWIVTKDKCYIENKKGREEVHTFGVCPRGCRMMIWEKDDVDDAREGEMDIRETLEFD